MFEPIAKGQLLAGKYRVERLLGEGGMGVVVAARHLQLDEPVAIKFMQPSALLNAEAIARFTREARAAFKIKSEHVARVSDVGVLENGAPYIVMEYLEGGDLSAWLKQRGPLPVEQAAELVLQASEAIAEAHALGIVHRDLKPANLFVTQRPGGALSVKVLDFGISKMTSLVGAAGPDLGITKTSEVIGSPQYMSPEQMRSGRDVDARTDIWALGVILYELLSGALPFAAQSYPELVLQIAMQPAQPLRARAPSVPPGLAALIDRCLHKDPGQRFSDVAEFAAALVEFAPWRSRLSLERISGALRETGPLAGATLKSRSLDSPTVLDPATSVSWGQSARTGAGHKRALLGLVALLVAGALALIVYAAQPRSPSASASVNHALPIAVATLARPAVTPPMLEAASPAPVAGSGAASVLAPVITPPTEASARVVEKAAMPKISPETKKPPAALPATSKASLPVAAAKHVEAGDALAAKPKPAVKTPSSVFDDR